VRVGIPALVALAALSLATDAVESSPIVLIYRLTGESSVVPGGGGETHPAELFDWLSVGDEIRVGKDGRIAIVFVTGTRYELTGPAAAELTAEGLRRAEGKVEALPPIPPLPLPLRSAHPADAFAGTRLGGVVLRGSGLSWIYPRQGATTDARETTLRFGASSESAAGYRVVLEDEDGTVLLHTVVKEREVALPPDLLDDGRRYYWRVLALEEAGTSGVAEGDFRTLDSESASRRRILQPQLGRSNDAYVLALLAEAERSLGLVWESRENFCEAHRLAPEDATLRKRCEDLESLLQR
jgi:hypothetical protein